jgi:hypothetical protein
MSQPNFETNADAQFALAAIEKYINDSVTLAFPMIAWDIIVTYDRDDAGNIVAVLQEESGIFYNVIFSQGDPNPIVQRFVEEEEGTNFAEALQADEPDKSIALLMPMSIIGNSRVIG